MPADRENINRPIVESVDHAVFLRESTRPKTAQVVLQCLRLANAHGGIAPLYLLENPAQVEVPSLVCDSERLVALPGIASLPLS
jgi:hypothetical protein